MMESDILSRNCREEDSGDHEIHNPRNNKTDLKLISKSGKDEEANHSKILEIHKKLSHRKDIYQEVEKDGLKISRDCLKKILKDCIVCREYDRIYYKSGKHIVVNEPGEIFAVDIMQINSKYKVTLGIDYFSRKA